MSQPETVNTQTGFARRVPAVEQGLTAAEVRQRLEAGACNTQPKSATRSVGQIILKNTLTLFNLINLVLAVTIALVGSYKNTLFLGIAICNTLMGIIQELRAKRTLDKLAILSQAKVNVVRDGQGLSVEQSEVVLDDIVYLSSGSQIAADAEVLQSAGMEVDESLLTGEGDNIPKQPGDSVMSGSFVTAGHGYVRVTAVGEDNYATRLTMEAKKEKAPKSQLMRTMNNIIKVLTIVIIPVGALLFYTQYSGGGQLQQSVLGASAAMLGMIPEGLILLTGVTLTVSALNLARKKTLVQSLPSIETLARVDVLCLDKTGTITDGTLQFAGLEPQNGASADDAGRALAELVAAVQDDNATATALREAYGSITPAWQAVATVPFSSARKWSGAAFAGGGSYVMGAPGFVFPGGGDLPFFESVRAHAAEGRRVLCLAHSPQPFGEGGALPEGLVCTALVVLSDRIRPEAPETFRYFAQEGVILKVISGDDPLTVSSIAAQAGLAGADSYVDMSQFGQDDDFTKIVEQYTVFGRVSPHQKKGLIHALKQNGHTACMTGDGVNDVLAMKEADCSVAMIGGSDAARGACDFVLMTSNFEAMIHVLREGRRVINNIENVSSLYLVKTIYSTLLALLYIFIPAPYPFEPLQMTPINTLTVGIPSFFLALRSNYHRPEGRFIANVLENSVPAALIVVCNVLIIQLAGWAFGLSHLETSTMIIFLTATVGFTLLYKVSQPITLYIQLLLGGLMAAFLVLFIFFGDFFTLGSLFTRNVFFYVPLAVGIPRAFTLLSQAIRRMEDYFAHLKEKHTIH